jgi:hypothetical protein
MGVHVAAATPASRPFVLASLRALRLDPEAPSPAQFRLTTDQSLVSRAEKPIPTQVSRPLDMPFHISAATGNVCAV